MNCAEARDTLLVADHEELRGENRSPFAEHLAQCAECRSAASAIVRQSAQLAHSLDARRRRRRYARRIVLLSSLPIAAGIVAVVVLRGGEQRPPEPEIGTMSLPAAQNVSVDVTPGQQTTVLRTADSTVTVIWLSPGVGQ